MKSGDVTLFDENIYNREFLNLTSELFFFYHNVDVTRSPLLRR